MDVEEAIEELARSSFIEVSVSGQDNERFLTVPLVASLFGQRKLAASPLKIAVEADVQLLQAMGAARPTDVRHGIEPRIRRLFQHIAAKINQSQEPLEEYLPSLEFIARRHSPGWMLLASLFEEPGPAHNVERAKAAVRSYLEQVEEPALRREAWERLQRLCAETEDWPGEAHALAELTQEPGTSLSLVSNAANRLNQLLSLGLLSPDSDERPILIRRVVDQLEERIENGDATDCSRLAWLFLNLHDTVRAEHYANLGLKKDPNNDYCLGLTQRLSK